MRDESKDELLKIIGASSVAIIVTLILIVLAVKL